MNRVFKIIWNKSKCCFSVVSEIAKNHKKTKAVSKKTLVLFVSAFLVGSMGIAHAEVSAASLTADQQAVYNAVLKELENKGVHYVSVKGESQDNDSNYKNDGAKGKGAVAIGEKALASKGGAVSIGRNAHIGGSGGNTSGEGSVAIGDNSLITTNGLDLASIAIGKNAKVLNGSGKQERGLSFTPDNFDKPGFFGRGNTLPKNADKVPGGIAIGTNSYARTGSIQLGHHTFAGYKMGGIDVTKANEEANIVGMTTVGTNTYNKGALANMYGAYSIITGDFTGEGGTNSWTYGPQNFGANVVGSLNSIRSKGHDGSSGVANSIVGVANTVENANGTLVYGAGNKITNSIKHISPEAGFTTLKSWEDTVTGLQKVIKNSDSGGAVLAIGGGNVADYVRHSQLVGVNNTVTGTENKVSEFNMVNGYNNTVDKGSYNIVVGVKRKLTGTSNDIILGSQDEETETKASEIVSIGYKSNAKVKGGIALGSYSIASIDKGIIGYDPLTGKASKETSAIWKATQAALSVGSTEDKNNLITRQITGVAAGTEDTDAVNVAQLKALSTKVDKGGVHYFSVKSTDEMPNYNNDGAQGERSVAIGPGSTTKFRNGLSVGTNNLNDGYETTVVGSLNKAYGLGDSAYAYGATIVGTGNTIMSNKGTLAMGSDNIVHEGIAIGSGNKAMGENAVAMGNYSSAMYTDSMGIGFGAHGEADGVVAIGRAAKGDALAGVAIGRYAEVHASTGVALGDSSISSRGAGVVGYMPGAVGQTAEEVAAYLGKADEYKSWKEDRKANQGAYDRAKAWHAAVDAERKAHNEVNQARIAYAKAPTEENKKALTEKQEAWKKASDERQKTDVAMRPDFKTINDLNARYGQIFGKLMSTEGAVSVGDEKTGRTRQIINVAAGTKDTDAVNVYQLKAVESKITQAGAGAQKHTSVTEGTNISVTEDGTNKEGGKNYKVSLAKDIDLGQDGSIKAGNTTINKDGVTTNTVKAGDTTINNNGLNIKDGPVITKTNVDVKNQQIHHVKDGTADDDAATVGQVNKKIDEITKTVAGSSVTGGTIGEDGKISLTKADKTTVELQGQLKDISARAGDYEIKDNKVTIGLEDNYSKKETGRNIVIKDVAKASLLAKEVNDREKADIVITETIGAANKDELKTAYQDTTYIKNSTTLVEADKALDKAIGKNAGDIKKNTETINILGKQVGNLDTRVNRVGAGAAALAALHPLDFDPDDKWDFAAGYGNYKGANAAAIGAYYRPNEDTMFSVGGSFGGGENMVNAGVSVKLGQGNHVSTSKVAMAKDMLAMQKRMAEMEAQMAKMQGFIGALTGVDTQTAMFPDVPENHWAYEYVKGLCEKGIIKGYPDGNFNGNRSMTRYEFAAMLYRALAKGVNLDARAVKEFAPELGRIRVDVISQNKEGQPVIERVRVNEEKKEK